MFHNLKSVVWPSKYDIRTRFPTAVSAPPDAHKPYPLSISIGPFMSSKVPGTQKSQFIRRPWVGHKRMHERSTSSEGSGGGGELLWYFAYGSNMSVPFPEFRIPISRSPSYYLPTRHPQVFRKIHWQPRDRPARNGPRTGPRMGAGFEHPRAPIFGTHISATLSNATVSANSGSSEIESDAIIPELELGPDFGLEIPDIIGVAYLITASQYIKVLGSEGGGIAYEDIEVDAVPLDETDREQTGPRLKVRTLGAAIERYPPPKPSKRYMVSAQQLESP